MQLELSTMWSLMILLTTVATTYHRNKSAYSRVSKWGTAVWKKITSQAQCCYSVTTSPNIPCPTPHSLVLQPHCLLSVPWRHRPRSHLRAFALAVLPARMLFPEVSAWQASFLSFRSSWNVFPRQTLVEYPTNTFSSSLLSYEPLLFYFITLRVFCLSTPTGMPVVEHRDLLGLAYSSPMPRTVPGIWQALNNACEMNEHKGRQRPLAGRECEVKERQEARNPLKTSSEFTSVNP